MYNTYMDLSEWNSKFKDLHVRLILLWTELDMLKGPKTQEIADVLRDLFVDWIFDDYETMLHHADELKQAVKKVLEKEKKKMVAQQK